jgi:hypothetical protein
VVMPIIPIYRAITSYLMVLYYIYGPEQAHAGTP